MIYRYFVVLLFVTIGVTIYAQEIPDKNLHAAVMKGIDQILLQRYDSAKITFSTIVKRYPLHPSGYLYSAATLQAEYSDYKDKFDEDLFDSLVNKGQDCAQKMIEQREMEWGYYYSGLAYAYLSYNASERGNLPKGILYGFKAKNQMQNCLEINPNFYAAMNVLGTYYYWGSALSWLPFLSNKREEGVKLIRTSIEQCAYEHVLGKKNLVVIFNEEKRYTDAVDVGLSVLKIYPDNRNFLWGVMKAAEKLHNDSLHEAIVCRLLQSTLNAPIRNYYREAVCRIALAEYAFSKKYYQNVIEETKKTIALKPYLSVSNKDLNNKILRAEELLAHASARIKN